MVDIFLYYHYREQMELERRDELQRLREQLDDERQQRFGDS